MNPMIKGKHKPMGGGGGGGLDALDAIMASELDDEEMVEEAPLGDEEVVEEDGPMAVLNRLQLEIDQLRQML